MSAPPGTVSLQDLTLEQIGQVRSQLEQELKHLTAAFGDLKAAQSKFMACMESLDSIKPDNKDKKVLIPLTGSLYVPGRIADPENVLVDIGTGYFVEKETKQAKALYNAKVLALKSNLATLQQQIEKKQDNFTACGEMMRVKMAQQQQAQAAGGAKDD
ncbi:subunit of tubulin prefoldin [Rhodotorula toruloides]|uniref:BY PROTMAP: gi/472587283/gb/EMS24782.1/ prefoldin subunit 5 [Rhodosporidium toruloides NP11] gi/647401210/emb/CDR47292.1/ RHTO0S14e01728g1_1 [Rhodosporidium toruloides] n=1 Tax=Rhodotorula toruloides TaxID=5286 RepID=A0A0K3CEB7_RHOTO|nr:Prefoldin subunit 5 [Rhodotorula toruloides]PRQ77142.1 Prefoldin-domain-containing protein [Rhodotorula toruloides]